MNSHREVAIFFLFLLRCTTIGKDSNRATPTCALQIQALAAEAQGMSPVPAPLVGR